MKQNYTAALLGDINIDTIMPVDSYPMLGGDSFAKSVTTMLGGGIVNTGYTLKNLSITPRLLAALGDDTWSEYAKEILSSSGFDLSYISHVNHQTSGIIFIPVTHDGERTMFSCRGANQYHHPDEIPPNTIDNVDILHISSYALMDEPQRSAALYAMKLAKQAKVPISLDLSLKPALIVPHTIDQILPTIQILALGMEEAKFICGCDNTEQIFDTLINLGIKLIGIKQGKDGCIMISAEDQLFLPRFPVISVDATGAGDSYCAGLITGWLQGFDLAATGALANGLGALATTVYGGGPKFPDKEQVLAFYKGVQDKHLSPTIDHGIDVIIKWLIQS